MLAASDCSSRRIYKQYFVGVGSPNRNTFSCYSSADVCVFPVPTPNKRQPPSGHLTAANGSKINTWGLHKLTLNFGNKHTYKQDFYFADVTRLF